MIYAISTKRLLDNDNNCRPVWLCHEAMQAWKERLQCAKQTNKVLCEDRAEPRRTEHN